MNTISATTRALNEAPPMPYESCKAHVTACLMGETRAWQDFVGIYKPHITKTVQWTLQHNGAHAHLASDTEDVVQEVFYRLVRGNYRLLETWNSERGTFTTWLTVVSRSATIDYLRNRGNSERCKALHIPLDECPELLADTVIADEALNLPRGVLSPRQQSILHLLFEKDMTPEEIAAFLDIHPQTVRSIRHSALLKLKEHYANEQ